VSAACSCKDCDCGLAGLLVARKGQARPPSLCLLPVRHRLSVRPPCLRRCRSRAGRGRARAAGGWCHRGPSLCGQSCRTTRKSHSRCRPVGGNSGRGQGRLAACMYHSWCLVSETKPEARHVGQQRSPAQSGKREGRCTNSTGGMPHSRERRPAPAHLEGLVPEEVDLVKVLLNVQQAVRLVPALLGTMQSSATDIQQACECRCCSRTA